MRHASGTAASSAAAKGAFPHINNNKYHIIMFSINCNNNNNISTSMNKINKNKSSNNIIAL